MYLNNIKGDVNFGKVKYIESPTLEKKLAEQKPAVKKLIEKASKDLINSDFDLVIYSRGVNDISCYVDMGDDGLNLIDKAYNEGKDLLVSGYTINRESLSMHNTDYVWYRIPLKTEKQAEKFAKAINLPKFTEYYPKELEKSVQLARALDKMI